MDGTALPVYVADARWTNGRIYCECLRVRRIYSKAMRILFRHLDPGQSGAVSSLVKMLEGYCERFPEDELTVMCTPGSPFVKLARLRNCSVEIVGKHIPREAYLLGAGDVAV